MTQQTLDGKLIWVRPPAPAGMCMTLSKKFLTEVPIKKYLELGCFDEPDDHHICGKLGYCEKTKNWVEWVGR